MPKQLLQCHCMSSLGIDRLDIQEVIRASVQHLNSLYSGVYLYSALHNGYRRFDPQRGMEYIVDMVLQDMSNKDNLVYKRIQLVRPLGQVSFGWRCRFYRLSTIVVERVFILNVASYLRLDFTAVPSVSAWAEWKAWHPIGWCRCNVYE